MVNEYELDIAEKEAWSIEPRRPQDITYIGTRQREIKTPKGTVLLIMDFYKDEECNYWYKSKQKNLRD